MEPAALGRISWVGDVDVPGGPVSFDVDADGEHGSGMSMFRGDRSYEGYDSIEVGPDGGEHHAFPTGFDASSCLDPRPPADRAQLRPLSNESVGKTPGIGSPHQLVYEPSSRT